MLTFFDYVYYRVCVFYDKNKQNSPGVIALFILSTVQIVNLLTVLFLADILFGIRMVPNKIALIIICALFLFINGIRYNKFNYQVLKEKWHQETPASNNRGRFVFLYIVLSFLTVFILAICFGGNSHV
jgi:hypothetical protein